MYRGLREHTCGTCFSLRGRNGAGKATANALSRAVTQASQDGMLVHAHRNKEGPLLYAPTLHARCPPGRDVAQRGDRVIPHLVVVVMCVMDRAFGASVPRVAQTGDGSEREG